ncbi:hypothetical protein HOLleu_26938 [Holothuria leucospilota]|uniref:Uncharacterized protein n=1 Tax=Holothuria leucospilota TaxID=206669 RepID=A0A9Q1H2V3_HOLLE|nr:hypothetical protein HOLleu_26938 [Holothuria leucospilota]
MISLTFISLSILDIRLYLPASPAFPEILDDTQHVVFIAIGYSNFHDFEKLSDNCISADGTIFDLSIPLLSNGPEGIPQYSLALATFYGRERGDIPKSNIIFPYILVDEITMNETSVIMRNGTDEMQLSLFKPSGSCSIPDSITRHEFESYIKTELQFGLHEPEFFSFCDDIPLTTSIARLPKQSNAICIGCILMYVKHHGQREHLILRYVRRPSTS